MPSRAVASDANGPVGPATMKNRTRHSTKNADVKLESNVTLRYLIIINAVHYVMLRFH